MKTRKSLSHLTLMSIVFLFMTASSYAQIGRVGINTTTPAAMLHVKDSSVVFTGNGVDFNSPAPVSGNGARMMWFPARQAFRVGSVVGDYWDKENIGLRSFAQGLNTRAIGESSVAMGWLSTASGNYSFAAGSSATATGNASAGFGSYTLASGSSSFASGYFSQATGAYSFASNFITSAAGAFSFASGYQTMASGQFSFVAGGNSTASAPYSVAFGNTIANTHSLFAIGLYNDTTAINQSWYDGDHLFVIGNGTSFSNRSNAVTVLKGGNVGITTSDPKTKLHITGGEDAGWDMNGYLQLGPTTNANVVFDNNEILARNNGAASDFYIQRDGGNLLLCDLGFGDVAIGNNNPATKLHVSGGAEAALNTNGYLQLGPTNSENLIFDDNEILARNNGAVSDLILQADGGKVGIGNNNPSSKLHVTGGGIFTNYTSPGYAIFGPTNGLNMVFDPQNIVARNNGGPALLLLQAIGGDLSLCSGSGKVGIGPIAATEKLSVSGNGLFTGTVTAAAFNTSSDIRYKINIKPIENALVNIHDIHGITYDWDREHFPDKQFNDRRQIGVSAQELENVYPEMVFTDAAGYKTVDYSRLTPVLIEAMKELSAEVEEMKKMMAEMQEQQLRTHPPTPSLYESRQ